MSGGQWEHAGYRIQEALQLISEDPEVSKRWPETSILFAQLGKVLYEIEHEMDWCVSGDTSIDDDVFFDKSAVGRLQRATVLQKGPVG